MSSVAEMAPLDERVLVDEVEYLASCFDDDEATEALREAAQLEIARRAR